MDIRQQTINVYDRNAQAMADKFRRLGPRKKDIDLAFELRGKVGHEMRVLELGCGDGRDAEYINTKAGWYLGTDISKGLIKIAKEYVPGANFQIADASSFEYPENLDIIFAFASLLHLDKEEVRTVLQKAHTALTEEGIFYISLKWSPAYKEEIKADEFGERQFYFYNKEIIDQLAGSGFKVLTSSQQDRFEFNSVEWFEIALQKV